MTRVELTLIGWSDAEINRAVETAYNVARLNGNRRGVRDRITCVTDSLDVVHTYDVKRHKNDATNLGCCYYTKWWEPETRSMVTAAIIYVNPKRDHGDGQLFTFTHEVAHALTQGAHGYTWRRMYTLLLPLFWRIFDHPSGPASGRMWLDLEQSCHNTVARYGVRYAHGYVRAGVDEDWLSRFDKIDREVRQHVAAARRYYDRYVTNGDGYDDDQTGVKL
jgi:hypothetical protein